MASHKGLLFSLEHFNLCCPAERMQEVILLPREEVREIPGVRSLFRGIFRFRNDVLPLLNLSLLFHMGENEQSIIPVGVMELDNRYNFGLTISAETEIIDYHDFHVNTLERGPRGIDIKLFQGYIQSFGKMIFILSIDYFRKYFEKK